MFPVCRIWVQIFYLNTISPPILWIAPFFSLISLPLYGLHELHYILLYMWIASLKSINMTIFWISFIGSYDPTTRQFDPVNLKMIQGEILILRTLLSEVAWKWSAPVLGRWAIFGLRYCSQICPHVFTSVLQLPWESLCYWTPPRILMVFQFSLCLVKMQKPECLSATTIEHQSARDVPLWNFRNVELSVNVVSWVYLFHR